MAKQWLLLQGNEDGNPTRWLTQEQLDEILEDPEGWDVSKFLDLTAKELNPQYWVHGEAMLLKVEVVIPQPTVVAYRIKD